MEFSHNIRSLFISDVIIFPSKNLGMTACQGLEVRELAPGWSSDPLRPKYAGIWWSRVRRRQLVKGFEVRDFLGQAPGRTRMLAQKSGGKNDRDEPIRIIDDVKAINSILNGQWGLQGRSDDIIKWGNLPIWGSHLPPQPIRASHRPLDGYKRTISEGTAVSTGSG